VARKPKVGREKDPDVDRIRALAPDLVLANVEENRREVVEALRRAGIAVWVTFPRTVAAGIALVREIGAVSGAEAAGAALAAPLEAAYQAARAAAAAGPPVRVFCPIWRAPYMTVSRDTYVHDVLATCGAANVFADREPRYPTIDLDELRGAAPEVILLPDEPFRFRPAHLRDFAGLGDVPAVRAGRIHLVDGKLLTWHGPRIAEALERLPPLLHGSPPSPSARSAR